MKSGNKLFIFTGAALAIVAILLDDHHVLRRPQD